MIYFDYASSTPLDKDVLSSYAKILDMYFANPSAIHKQGLESANLLEKSRSQIASILHIKEDEIIFTSGASESNNLAIKGVAFKYKNRGKHLITSKVEHPSVLNVFKQLENDFGYEVTYLDVNQDGVVSLDELKKNIRKDTILVSLMHVNNETGSINDVELIGKYIKDNYPTCIFHCDDTQGFGKIDCDYSNIDLISMSAHKIYGLKGSGLLIKKENINLEILINGGEQEFGLRGGTSNFATIAALAKTIRLQFENKQKDYNYISNLNSYLREKVEDIDSVYINSPLSASPYILNISVMGIKNSIMSEYLSNKDICVSTTSACGSNHNVFSYVIEDMYPNTNRSNSAIRISFSKFNNKDEIDKLVDAIKEGIKEIVK